MKKFIVLQRDFMSAKPKEQFALVIIEARDVEAAWIEVDAELSTNNSQEWLLTKEELSALKNVLKKGVK